MQLNYATGGRKGKRRPGQKQDANTTLNIEATLPAEQLDNMLTKQVTPNNEDYNATVNTVLSIIDNADQGDAIADKNIDNNISEEQNELRSRLRDRLFNLILSSQINRDQSITHGDRSPQPPTQRKKIRLVPKRQNAYMTKPATKPPTKPMAKPVAKPMAKPKSSPRPETSGKRLLAQPVKSYGDGEVRVVTTSMSTAVQQASKRKNAKINMPRIKAPAAVSEPRDADTGKTYRNAQIATRKGAVADCLIDRTRKMILSFTPRASCTLAVSVFVHHMGLYSQAKAIHEWIHHFRRNVMERKPQYVASNRDWENPNMVKIKVVRNPYHRAVSSYTHFVRSCESTDQSFEQYLAALINGDTCGLTLHELTVRDYHSKPQHNGQLDRTVNEIVKVEEIESRFKLIDYRYKTTFTKSLAAVQEDNSHVMAKDKTIREYVGNKNAGFFRLPNREFRLPDYPYFYNRKTRELVETLYGDDMRYFGYTYPWGHDKGDCIEYFA